MSAVSKGELAQKIPFTAGRRFKLPHGVIDAEGLHGVEFIKIKLDSLAFHAAAMLAQIGLMMK